MGPDQHASRRAGRGMHEVRVTGAVRRLDLDIPFTGRLRVATSGSIMATPAANNTPNCLQ